MDGTHAAPAASRHTLHFGRALAGGIAAVAIVAIVAVGAMLLVNRGTNNGPAAPTAKPSVSVTATNTITAVLAEGTRATTDADIDQLRAKKVSWSSTGSDPRIVGTLVAVMNEDTDSLYGTEYNGTYGPVPTKVWGTMTLTGPDGTWTGSYAGFAEGWITSRVMHQMAAALVGTGAYAGLQYRFAQTSRDGTSFQASGVIEPAPSMAAQSGTNTHVAGMDYCEKMFLGPGATQKKVGQDTQTRNASATCNVDTNEPRVNGTSTRTLNEDLGADGTFTTWGTSDLVNAGGTWTGVFVNVSRDGMTVNAFALVGSGGYAGLRFHGAGTAAGLNTYSVDGAIEPAS